MYAHKVTPEQWAAVDWRRPNRELAAELGVTKQRIVQMRKKLAPHTIAQPQPQLRKLVEDLRRQLLVARRAFTTTEALLRDVLEERDAALAKLAAATQPDPAEAPPADPIAAPAKQPENRTNAAREPAPDPPQPTPAARNGPAPAAAPEAPRGLPTPAGLTTWQPVTGPDAPPLPATKPRRRSPRSPRTDQALAGTLKDTWHNPGAASGADGTNNHP